MGERATTDDGERLAGRPVRVRYVAEGFGVALVVADGSDQTGADGTTDDTVDTDGDHGVLHISDAVMTLEIPRADGGRSVLSWDPTEVTLDPLVA